MENKEDRDYFEKGFVEIPCQVWEGTHPGEVGVLVKTEGRRIVSFLPKTDVESEYSPRSDSFVDGWVRAFIVSETQEEFVVDIPDENFSNEPLKIPKNLARPACKDGIHH